MAADGGLSRMIYELKRYTPHPGKGEALRARFMAHTLPVFARLGMDVVAVFAPRPPLEELVYILAFEDEDRRTAAWAAFGSDSEWREIKARTEQDGPLLAQQQTELLHALLAPALPLR
ncbi:NIPSNAP protein [Paracidovorax anthurii]|uniref:NIPSNAP protein n=2 Tax=Paracidovorax anthurii TaxID=78229 RepID=A0A328ZGZ2_9BURK|nr:NIPSNAP protein [Paracidovorax anthurii]